MLHTKNLQIIDTETATSHVEDMGTPDPMAFTEAPNFRDSAFSRLIGVAPAFIALVGLVSVWAS